MTENEGENRSLHTRLRSRAGRALSRVSRAARASVAVGRATLGSLRKRTDARLVVFIADYPRGRVAKLAFALRQCGWRVVLLYKHKSIFDTAAYFDEVVRYTDAWQALTLATRYRA